MKMILSLLMLGFSFGQTALAMPPVTGFGGGFANNLPADTGCSLSAGASVVDYGIQSRWQLQDAGAGGNTVTPGKRLLMLNVVCPYTQTMDLILRGESAASGDLRYGDRGNVKIRLSDAQLDGQSVQIAKTTATGIINGSPENILYLQPGQHFSAVINDQLAKGKAFAVRMEIEPTLKESDARVSSRQTSESLLTFELLK